MLACSLALGLLLAAGSLAAQTAPPPTGSKPKATAKKDPKSTLPVAAARSALAKAVAAADQAQMQAYVPPPWCAHRPKMSVVAAYDDGKWFSAVATMSQLATEQLARALCPGDTIRLASFGTALSWWGDALEFTGPDTIAELVKRVKKRPTPSSQHSVNDVLVKGAFGYWETVPPERMRALFVFTDTIESDAPPKHTGDFAWTALPSFMSGQFLLVVSLLEKSSPANRPLIYVTAAPPPKAVGEFPSGGTTTYADIMSEFIPPPPPKPTESTSTPTTVEVMVVQASESWLEQPRVLAALGAGVALLVIGAYLLGRISVRRWTRRKAREATTPTVELTIILRDRLSGRVVREETRAIEAPLRLSSSTAADFFVPGPYALELQRDAEQGLVLRSGNMLGLELLRSGGRRLALADGDSVKLSSGDRVDIGGGQEVELKIH